VPPEAIGGVHGVIGVPPETIGGVHGVIGRFPETIGGVPVDNEEQFGMSEERNEMAITFFAV